MVASGERQASGSLGDFLKSRRAALSPTKAGVEDWGKRRRVPGLRREEVAQLAGVSVAYYIRLEQGLPHNASDEVLLSLARALQLTSTETEHLLDLAKPSPIRPSADARPEHAHPHALAMLDAIGDKPAVLLGRRSDALAWTPTGHALLAPHVPFDTSDPRTRPSLPRLLFLDPSVRRSYADWESEARLFVAYLRLISGKYPDDSRLAELVGELCMKDADFAAMWASGRVGQCTAGLKHFEHPLVGALTVEYQLWLQADSPDHRIEVYSPANSEAQTALERLSALVREKSESKPGQDRNGARSIGEEQA
ncbi:helix-turn-helix domain-containing protein [Gulosibacter sp. 10]|uniref:helix-turn-helix domain-containing protein n=1 Tax=Gulosibacter sp. 10 TaxID=1255570 RepID=UPI000B34BD58|nr:helix-turn-helix transcriptional regulator [Gulosibacter sp. 10]